MQNAGAMTILRGSSLFRGVPEAALASTAALCRNRTYGRGETVFCEGTAGDRLYGVIAGRLLITTTSSDGAELHLNVAEAGEIVGEIAFLDGGLRTASARAAEPTTCFEIERTAFMQLLDRTPELSTHLMQLVCKRVRWMTRLVSDAAFLSVPERLAARLLQLAAPLPQEIGAEVRISQGELAQFLGISRQVVNGYLRTWQREGRIELKRGTIRIKNLAGVGSEAPREGISSA